MRDPIISYPWADEAQTMVDFQKVKVNGELATDLLNQRDRFREALESIRDSFSQMNDNQHSNTAYALATQALDPEGCAEMAKLPWPPDEQILADLKAIDQSH